MPQQQWYQVWQQICHAETAPPDPDAKLRWPDWAMRAFIDVYLKPQCRIYRCTALRQGESGLVKWLHIAVPALPEVQSARPHSWAASVTTIPATKPFLLTLRQERMIDEDGDEDDYDNVSWIAAEPGPSNRIHWLARESPEGGPVEASIEELWPQILEYWATQPNSPPAGESAPTPSPGQSQDEGPEPDIFDDILRDTVPHTVDYQSPGDPQYSRASRDVPVNLQSPGTVSAAEERIAAEEQRTGRRLSVTERARRYFQVYEESRRGRRR